MPDASGVTTLPPRRDSRRRGPSRRVRLRRTIAVTVLLVLAVAVSARLVTRDDAPRVPVAAATHSTASSDATTSSNEDGSSASEAAPTKVTVPQSGTGDVHVIAVPAMENDVPGRTVRYTVEVEGDLGVDEAEVGRTVETVLLDDRGWQQVDGVRFVNVTPAQAKSGAHVDIRVTLASPSLTDRLCAPMQTLSQVSCWNDGRSVLNLRRWVLGDDSYGSDVTRYRVYQVNHEVGHGLGHQHRLCPGAGKRAPVMVQQTLDLGGCKPWPFPSGA